MVMLAGALLVGGCALVGRDAPAVDGGGAITWKDVRRLPKPEAVPALTYGTEPQQFGELRLPPGVDGPFPVVVLIHGLCWGKDEGLDYLRPLAASLSKLGVATWTIEYRRLGEGGGWPETFLDVARATDHLRVLAQTYPLDLKRVATVGHAGGGQLALWLAARKRIVSSDPLYLRDPLSIRGVIGLAAVTDLERQRAATATGCGAAVDALLAAAPEGSKPPHTRVSPASLLPLRVPQWFVHGALDTRVAAGDVLQYAEQARRRGDKVTTGITNDAGHFEPVVPGSATWMTLQQAVVAALLQ